MRKFTDVLEEYLEERHRQQSDYYENRRLGESLSGISRMESLANDLNEMVRGVENEKKMNERMYKLINQCFIATSDGKLSELNTVSNIEKFAALIVKEMHRKVIASILITDVFMEEKGQKPTSEDYIRAIHKDFGVEK